MTEGRAIIVGTGHAGAQAAIALRQSGFDGPVMMISRDAELPYERPPLSKDYLSGDKPFERILIRPPQFWADKAIEFRLSSTVSVIEPSAHTVSLSDGETLHYAHLIWAAGGEPRRLTCPGADLGGIHYVRSKQDADALAADLAAGGKRIVVIGGGYIGLEAAAVLRKLGCTVTLVEAQPRLLARVAGEELSRFFETEHRAQGVEVRTGSAVSALVGERGRITDVTLEGGETLKADLVIVGIGIEPAIGPLVAAGAAGQTGVEVDQYCRTSLEDIYAIGDCAAHANPYARGAMIRLESVQNANDMANVAAKAICGDPQPYHALPWFWSNQYDLKLQSAGLTLGHDTATVRGDPASRSFSVIYRKDARVVAIDCVNAVKDYVQGRKLIEAGRSLTVEELGDTRKPLRDLVGAG